MRNSTAAPGNDLPIQGMETNILGAMKTFRNELSVKKHVE
jgi:hypothetical protein